MKVSLWRIGGLTLGILAGLYLLNGRRGDGQQQESSNTSSGDVRLGERNASEWFSERTLSPIHHELRTDLNLLTNYSELMTENATDDNSDARKVLMVSRKLTNAIEAFISSLRLRTEEFQPEPEEIPLKPFVNERIDWFQPLYDYLGRDLTVDLDPSPETASLDRRYFELILNSLLVESSEPPEGTTRIELSEATSNDQWTLRVNVQVRDRSWQKSTVEELQEYLAAGSPRKLVNNFSPGTGLRLFGVHELVTRHGGKFVLRAEEQDGVIFRCFL